MCMQGLRRVYAYYAEFTQGLRKVYAVSTQGLCRVYACFTQRLRIVYACLRIDYAGVIDV